MFRHWELLDEATDGERCFSRRRSLCREFVPTHVTPLYHRASVLAAPSNDSGAGRRGEATDKCPARIWRLGNNASSSTERWLLSPMGGADDSGGAPAWACFGVEDGLTTKDLSKIAKQRDAPRMCDGAATSGVPVWQAFTSLRDWRPSAGGLGLLRRVQPNRH